MRTLINRHKLTTALAVVGVYVALYLGLAALRGPMDGERTMGIDYDMIRRMFWPEFGLAASALAFTALFGWWRETRLTTALAAKSARVMLIPALAILLLIGLGETYTQMTGVSPTLSQGLTVIKTIIWVGVFEEVVFRGILFHGFESRFGPVRAVFGSSLLFGLMHYTNALHGQSLLISHFQVLHAFSIGVLFAALMLRTNSLWSVIVFHAFWDSVLALNLIRAGDLVPKTVPTARKLAPSLVLVGVELGLGLLILGLWVRRQRRALAGVQTPSTQRPLGGSDRSTKDR